MSRVLFFFFKQKTAYEMRISDWSSDVCSSDLRETAVGDLERHGGFAQRGEVRFLQAGRLGQRHRPRDQPAVVEVEVVRRSLEHALEGRSEERRVGKECVSTCR